MGGSPGATPLHAAGVSPALDILAAQGDAAVVGAAPGPTNEVVPTSANPIVLRTSLLAPGHATLPISLGHRALLVLQRSWRWSLALVLAGAVAAAFVPALVLGPRLAAEAVLRGTLVRSVVAVGQVVSPYRINIGSQVTGTVARVAVAEGQTVSEGQLLIQLDEREARAGTDQAMGIEAQARAQLAHLRGVLLPVAIESNRQAEATLLNAQRQLARAAALVASGDATRVTLDAARAAHDIAAAQLAAAHLQVLSDQPGGNDEKLLQTALSQAQAGLRMAMSRLGYTSIVAPSAGVLIARNVEQGDVVQPLATLLVLSPSGPPQLLLQVDERSFGQLQLGQRALVRADAYPDRRFTARVSFINPAVDASRASVLVKLDVVDPPSWLVQDMTVNVDITVAERENVLILPLSAVHDPAGAQPWVLRAAAGRARRVAVQLGLRGTRQAEVLAGLAEHDLVLPAAAAAAAGDRVRVQGP
jgi:HlyD family secretion protein